MPLHSIALKRERFQVKLLTGQQWTKPTIWRIAFPFVVCRQAFLYPRGHYALMTKSAHEDSFYKSLTDNLYDGVYFVDADRRITYWNRSAERITGHSARHIIGRFCSDNILDHVTDDGHHLCQEGCPLLATINDGQPREAEVHLRHAEGYRVPVVVRTSPIHDDQKRIIGAVEIFSNNQAFIRMKRRVIELEQDAFRDPLTGISNRKLLEIKINTAIREYRQHQISFGLLFLDIDHFKGVNDTYGHQEGDRVLQSIAKNMIEYLRATDLCGRWGGEEFIAVLYNLNLKELARVAEKLRAMIANSAISIGERQISITVSIGATLVRETDTLDTIVARADQLMYQSKQGGKNRVTVS
jgi:diguanylate cyclase (GGDEF)-like protein/PAS domain S-box-containing protein